MRNWPAVVDRIRGIDPDFFRRLLTTWHKPPRWTTERDKLFWRRHGDEMRALGYSE